MNRFRAGLDAEHFRGLIGEVGIESNGGKGASHEISLLCYIYTICDLYIPVRDYRLY
jgi:hypothetical protein